MTILEQLEIQCAVYKNALDNAKNDRERCMLVNAIFETEREIRQYKEVSTR